jgi:hypothetical protein
MRASSNKTPEQQERFPAKVKKGQPSINLVLLFHLTRVKKRASSSVFPVTLLQPL